jgi:primosomal protein N' (replication factor Y) (superfamily II helicase)
MVIQPKYIEVAVALPVWGTFTYLVPESLPEVSLQGKRVLVPFGQRRVTGYVLEEAEKKDEKEIKSVLDLLDESPLFPVSMIPFFRWISDYYIHPLGEVIKTALPGGLNLSEVLRFSVTERGKEAVFNKRSAQSEERILRLLMESPGSMKDLCAELKEKIPGSLLYSMEQKGWIEKGREIKAAKTKVKTERCLSLTDDERINEPLSKARIRIIETLRVSGEISAKTLGEAVPGAPRLLSSLEKDGYVRIFQRPVYRDPFGETICPDIAPVPTVEQNNVISKIGGSLGKGFFSYLLSGVTGSGKTEVYMQLASLAVKEGFSVLVLVPEIALISQMESRFRARFGECVSILHSGLSAGEKYDQWLRIAGGKTPVAIGARSAVFAPFKNVGLIIVDEEHDSSYKQEGGLRYNARDLAVVRAKLAGCSVLLGSATPSLQSYHNISGRKIAEVRLTKRVEDRSLPEISVVDLRESRDLRGIRRYISEELICGMRESLARKEQVLLFLNRRGFAGFPVCGRCGETLKCKNCDISLTLHRSSNAYRCHYCGYTKAANSVCRKCGSSEIKPIGLGTEKIEAAAKSLFPEARVARMDSDTTVRKGSTVKILKSLKERTIDILVGTQMVAKGHDYPDITLVGVICADQSLAFPDFRSGERTFQLLSQVSGRAGRGSSPGKVILQTYNPDHFSIVSAKNQDYRAFYEKELLFRKALNYPPFSRMIQIRIYGKDKKKTGEYAKAIGDLCLKLKREFNMNSVDILGPVEAPVPKIAGRFRWQILLKGKEIKPLHLLARNIMFESGLKGSGDVGVIVDVDPYFMM